MPITIAIAIMTKVSTRGYATPYEDGGIVADGDHPFG
jgi:hypothetical protein